MSVKRIVTVPYYLVEDLDTLVEKGLIKAKEISETGWGDPVYEVEGDEEMLEELEAVLSDEED